MIRISTLGMLFDSNIINRCEKLGQSLLIPILTFTSEGSLTLDEKGRLHLPPLEKAVPEDVEQLKKRVYALLPHVPLADLLLEVDAWTGFLRHFTLLTGKDAPVGTQKLELVATLMGMGMNLGLEKMAESCPYTYRRLS